jgi:biopolymer transport protein ExbB
MTEIGSLLEKGGVVMPLLFLGSVISVAIGIERYRVFRRADGNAEMLREQVAPFLQRGEWAQALAETQKSESLSSLVAAAGIKNAARGSRAAELAMEGAANRGAARLRQRLDILGLMVTMAPLLGLLGTVVGMIRAFNVLNVRSGQPFAITGGVGEALVATAAGLCVAILSLAMLAYFRNRLDRMLNDVEDIAAFVLSSLVEQES